MATARKAFQLSKDVLVPGTKWKLVREIARGGMGVTWEVWKEPGIRGVMKMILPDLVMRAGYVKRFFEEVKILTHLNHPNIVQVFDFDTLEDGTPFFVMERLEGKTLGAALLSTKGGGRVRKALPARIAYEITRQTCEALYRAHSFQPKGVIHRDIKPENIYIHHPSFGEPVIKLLDFGVAAFEEAARDAGPVGTPRYMAPEQLRCERITPKADLYAMGLILYEMLVGRGPFDDLADAVSPNDRALVLANAHLKETPPPPSHFAPWIPKTVDRLVLEALDKDPEKRPYNAYAFATKLFELQFVNDGKPREALDTKTTAPTLVRLIEDDYEDESRAGKLSSASMEARSFVGRSLSNDTMVDVVPAFAPGGTLQMTNAPINPFGPTTPRATRNGIDRKGPTRLSPVREVRRPVPKYDTVPIELTRASAAGVASDTKGEPTPLATALPSRPVSVMRAKSPSRVRQGIANARRAAKENGWLGLRFVGVFVAAPALGAAIVLSFQGSRFPLGEAPVVVVAAGERSATPSPLPAPSVASPAPSVALPAPSVALPAPSSKPPTLVIPVVEETRAREGTAAVAPTAAVRLPAPPPAPMRGPASSQSAPAKPPKLAKPVSDDGSDLLFVPSAGFSRSP